MTTAGAAGFDLRDETTFLRLVKVPRAATAVAFVALVLSGGALLYNLISTFRTDGANRSLDAFWTVFTSTNGTNPLTSVWLTVLVWAPLILIPICVASLVWALVTHRGVKRRVHRAFVADGGYVARQEGLDLGFQENQQATIKEVVALSHPGLDPAVFERLVGEARDHLADDGLDLSEVDDILRGGGVVTGAPLALILATAPPEVLVTVRRDADAVVVVPGSSASRRRTMVYELKG